MKKKENKVIPHDFSSLPKEDQKNIIDFILRDLQRKSYALIEIGHKEEDVGRFFSKVFLQIRAEIMQANPCKCRDCKETGSHTDRGFH